MVFDFVRDGLDGIGRGCVFEGWDAGPETIWRAYAREDGMVVIFDNGLCFIKGGDTSMIA